MALSISSPDFIQIDSRLTTNSWETFTRSVEGYKVTNSRGAAAEATLMYVTTSAHWSPTSPAGGVLHWHQEVKGGEEERKRALEAICIDTYIEPSPVPILWQKWANSFSVPFSQKMLCFLNERTFKQHKIMSSKLIMMLPFVFCANFRI